VSRSIGSHCPSGRHGSTRGTGPVSHHLARRGRHLVWSLRRPRFGTRLRTPGSAPFDGRRGGFGDRRGEKPAGPNSPSADASAQCRCHRDSPTGSSATIETRRASVRRLRDRGTTASVTRRTPGRRSNHDGQAAQDACRAARPAIDASRVLRVLRLSVSPTTARERCEVGDRRLTSRRSVGPFAPDRC
jgi:hypothetical protein